MLTPCVGWLGTKRTGFFTRFLPAMADENSGSPKGNKDSDVLIEMGTPGVSNGVNKGLHFRDGNRRIHNVIVYERCEADENKNEETMAKATEMQKKRDDYENELVNKGLEVERETITCPGVSVSSSKATLN